jgi:hypothetical protein
MAATSATAPVSPWRAPADDFGCPLTADQFAEQEAILADILGEPTGDPGLALVPYPDVSEHDHGGPGGPGFVSGSALDTALPGPALAAALEDTIGAGLESLSDDAVAGVILAARRCESRAGAMVLTAVAELDRRRHGSGDQHVIDHVDTEIALLLTLPRRSAGTLLNFAANLWKLPATTAALAEGRIHRAQADVLAFETAYLDAELAAAVEQLVLDDAPRLTTTRLQRRVRHAVLAADPAAARQRAEQAKRDARVEMQDERSGGTAALAGRDLPTEAALAANQRINHAARSLKAEGAPATLTQLRAAVFLGLLTSTDPLAFLPPPDEPATDQAPGTTQPPPADRHGAGPDLHTGEGEPAAQQPATESRTGSEPGPGPGLGVRGSVNLTLPLSTWLGAAYSPGVIAGFGPATAETCQQIADWIVENPGSRWCLTLTDAKGRAVGHGCARRPPPPPTDTQRLAEWLARLKIGPIQGGDCTHARAVPGYRIPDSLHHIVKIRQQTCSNPICVRPAVESDDDHTLAHDKGGITCECGLGPACRKCHQAKQAQGWRLEQPRPGEFVWRPPHGRSYPSAPDAYPI